MAKKATEEKQPKSGLVENNETVAAPVQPKEVKVEEKKVEEVNPHTIGHNTRAYRQ